MRSSATKVRRAATRAPRLPRPSERLLRVASDLFATQGIKAVGIDQILRDAGVAKASLYSWYGSKDALVLAYLNDLDQADRKRWSEAVSGLDDPTDKILAFFDVAIAGAPKRGYRGCLYANAAGEFPGAELPPVRAHRQWVRSTLAMLLTAAGVSEAAKFAREIQLLYDGALVGSKMERSVAPIKLGRRLAADALRRAGATVA
ncbi:TetR family transcriptional regulator [Mycobacterium alsense]|uniref:TetR family transcriptional regulator n=1 Tax=Mycobacterium alsense TaxID=324058 RepID=A0ABD6P0I5_9MYCO|nr:TetR/AcrR family transcriptional regulator [Mycobacterium alsense]OBG33889.1 TetR family transcriptional regulator [Mycobacterium alsense]